MASPVPITVAVPLNDDVLITVDGLRADSTVKSVRSLGLSPLGCREPPPQLPLDLAKKQLDCCSNNALRSSMAGPLTLKQGCSIHYWFKHCKHRTHGNNTIT